MEATSLVGPEWTVLMYNDTNAITSPILGTTITANFSEDGTLSGSAGCNNYTAGYNVDGNNIKIEPAATTRKMCSEPEGIMEQEAAYTLALERAVTYTIQLDQLTLFGAEGQIIAQYTTGQ
jgi:heat shock protein HslJ